MSCFVVVAPIICCQSTASVSLSWLLNAVMMLPSPVCYSYAWCCLLHLAGHSSGVSTINKLIPEVKIVHDASLLLCFVHFHFTEPIYTFVFAPSVTSWIAAVCLIDKNLLLCSNTLTVVQVKRTEGVSSTDIVGRMLMLVRDNNRFSEVCYTRGHAVSSTQRWSQQWQTVCSAETHHHHHVLDYLFDCEQSMYMSDSQEITEQSRTSAK